MRVVRRPTKCVARLAPGEVKRIPVRDTRYLVGYYLACPACGRVQAVPKEEGQFVESGMDLGEVPLLSMKHVDCTNPACGKKIVIEADEVSAA